LSEIALGMQALHDISGLMHCDLKNENIFLCKNKDPDHTEKYVAKIADFDNARPRALTVAVPIKLTPSIWTPPEVLRDKRGTDKIDVYGFGLVLYSIHSGKLPYEGYSHFEEEYVTLKRNGDLKFLETLTPHKVDQNTKQYQELTDITESCLKSNPNDRPKFKRLVARLTKLFPPPIHHS